MAECLAPPNNAVAGLHAHQKRFHAIPWPGLESGTHTVQRTAGFKRDRYSRYLDLGDMHASSSGVSNSLMSPFRQHAYTPRMCLTIAGKRSRKTARPCLIEAHAWRSCVQGDRSPGAMFSCAPPLHAENAS